MGNNFLTFLMELWQFADNKEKQFVESHDCLCSEMTCHLKIKKERKKTELFLPQQPQHMIFFSFPYKAKNSWILHTGTSLQFVFGISEVYFGAIIE